MKNFNLMVFKSDGFRTKYENSYNIPIKNLKPGRFMIIRNKKKFKFTKNYKDDHEL